MSAGPRSEYERRLESGEISPDPKQLEIVDRLQQLHEELSERASAGKDGFLSRLFSRGSVPRDPSGSSGLYIYGPPGRGKSMLMDLFFENAPIRPRKRVHVHSFMQDVHARLHKWRAGSGKDRVQDPLARLAAEIAKESPLLCFDEFQVEAIADAMIVRRLFEKMFEHGVVVVATSNTAAEDLYAGGLQRDRFLPFIDLLVEKLEVLCLEGETDYRRDRLKSVGIWHMPLGDKSASELDDAFDRLTDGAAGEEETLTVNGRALVVPKQARGVAAVRFADLCEQPLGAADYGAIACTYQTVILSGIPVMGANDRNTAKRFATLIESLYEQKTKLVCSADAAPEELYVEGDGSAIFERVVSRLEEMQAEDYLAAPHRPANSQVAA